MEPKSEKTGSNERMVVVGNGNWGLYYGRIIATDDEIMRDKAIRIYECRHICRWYGGTGGITSLATWGPCGSRAKESRIGAACPSSLITDPRGVHECTAEAVVAFAEIAATR